MLCFLNKIILYLLHLPGFFFLEVKDIVKYIIHKDYKNLKEKKSLR